jgi:hypothetical protein
MQHGEYSPNAAAYVRPLAKAAKVVAPVSFVVATLNDDVTLRLALHETDSEFTATLQHDYAGTEMVGGVLVVGEQMFNVTDRDGNTLTLEAV